MVQPISGVAPSQLSEVTIMTVWPSLSALGFGRFWGRLMAWEAGFRIFGVPVTLGRLWALVSIPFLLNQYFVMRFPRLPLIFVGFKNPFCSHYRLTNRRVVVENPYGGGEIKSVALDRFNAIDVVVQPGQAFYKAGDLVFRQGPTETFRLAGVPRPETFRHTCLKAHFSFVGVAERGRQGRPFRAIF